MTDEKIIELYFNRNEAAIAETSRKYGSYCFKIADNILNDREDAKECLNDTWMQAWNAIPPTRPAHLRLFLARLARNLSLNRYRAKYTQKRGSGETAFILDELEECLSGQSDVETLYIAKELQATINQFVRTLPEKEGNVFIRRYFFSDSIKEIADRYHISENNARVMLNRTRNKLRDRLEKEGYLS